MGGALLVCGHEGNAGLRFSKVGVWGVGLSQCAKGPSFGRRCAVLLTAGPSCCMLCSTLT